MKKLFVILFAVMMILCSQLVAAETSFALKADTIGAVYIDAAAIFNAYKKYIGELMKPENSEKLEEALAQMRQHVPETLDVFPLLQSFHVFAKSEVLQPVGAMWFSIDNSFRPDLSLKADVKPLALLDFVASRLETNRLKPVKKEKDLVQFEFDAPSFKVIFQVKPDGLFLFTDKKGPSSSSKADSRWNDLLKKVDDKTVVLAGDISLGAIGRLIGEDASRAKVSACVTNMRILANAVEMHNLDAKKASKELDQANLLEKKLLKEHLACPAAGDYSLVKGGSKEIACSVHGTVAAPVFPKGSDSIPAPVKPMETLRFSVSSNSAAMALEVNDKNILEQWLAIGKQQLGAIKHMAENQLGQVPEVKRKGLEMLNSVKLSTEGKWLQISLAELDEETMMSMITGLAGAGFAIAAPNFMKARQIAQEKACLSMRRTLRSAAEMFHLDKKEWPKDFKLELLVQEKFLEAVPECPDGGKYSIVLDGDKVEVECSVHGKD